jgi:anti-sigma factor RsiW
MTCDEFQARLPDYLEGACSEAERAALDSHLLDCAECAALVADLRIIVRNASELPVLTPSRDLWAGIESRIEAPVVSLTARISGEHVAAVRTSAVTVHRARVWTVQRLALAASVLVTVTAGITYLAARNSTPAPEVAAAPNQVTGTGVPVANVAARPTAEQTFDHEIAGLRNIVGERRGDLDSTTYAIIEKNLKVIDNAIAESKAALAKDPSSAFLAGQLNHAYDNKLQVLREVAKIPGRS